MVTLHAVAPALEYGNVPLSDVVLAATLNDGNIALAGNLRTGDQRWNIGAHRITARRDRIEVDNFAIEGAGQQLRIDGVVSPLPQDTLHIALAEFDIAPLSDVLRTGHNIEGRVSGRAQLTAALAQRPHTLYNTRARATLTADIAIDSLRVDHVDVPALTFRSAWENDRVRFSLAHKNGTPVAMASYLPATNSLEGIMDIKNVDLALLDTHYKRTLSGTTGRADVHAALSGRPGRGGGMRLNGEIKVHDYAAQVDFLGVRYAAVPNTTLRVVDNVVVADSVTMTDPEGNRAMLDAEIDLNKLKNVGFRFGIDTDNLLVLNTSQSDNAQFYGKVYASGEASITGNKQGVELDVDAATGAGSQFYMPLNDKHDVAEADFITFANQPDDRRPTPVEQPRVNRLNTNLTIAVEPNTQVELLIDPQTGHRVRGRGNGLLNIHLDPRAGEFTIYGDYRIDEGTYLFTLENIIEKPFAITPGSSIQWTGNPLDAMLDIAAVYSLKTSISLAMTGTGYDSWRMRIPVECHLKLTDRLSAPVLAFDITAPGATPETQTILHSFLDTEEMTATQFFFLLATGNFYDYEAGGGNLGVAAGSSTAFDLLSSQLNQIIASERVNIGIRYRPQTETTSDEWGVDFTQQLWGERLLLEVEGNYDTRNNSQAVYTENMRNFTGDFYLTGIVDRRGTLRAKAFTRTITRFDENQGLQESGAGIYFSEDFNNFGDIFRRWKRKKAAGND